MTDNIFKFPKDKIKIPTDEELQVNLDEYKHSFCEEISGFIINLVVGEMERANIYFEDNEQDNVAVTLIAESIKSAMLSKLGVYHPLQDVKINKEVEEGNDYANID